MARTKNVPFWRKPKKLDWKLIVLIVLFHLAVLYGLARVFAPDFTKSIERDMVSAFIVTVSVGDEEDLPEAPPDPDEGAQGNPGQRATPRAETAPESPIARDTPAPQASSTGTANRSGTNDSGDGTGAAGEGNGTGSGSQGSGTGNGQAIAQRPSVRSGNLNQARDFPVPEGGRETRFGKSVTVVFTVTTDGRAKNCSVARSSVDAQTTSLVCGLVIQKIRSNPAITTSGQPVEARYGYRVDFSAR